MRRSSLVPLIVLLAAAGCTSWRPAPEPAPAAVRASPSETVRIRRTNGSVILLHDAAVSGDSIVGQSDAFGRVAIATSDVAAVEVRRHDSRKTAGLLAGIAAFAGLLALAWSAVYQVQP